MKSRRVCLRELREIVNRSYSIRVVKGGISKQISLILVRSLLHCSLVGVVSPLVGLRTQLQLRVDQDVEEGCNKD